MFSDKLIFPVKIIFCEQGFPVGLTCANQYEDFLKSKSSSSNYLVLILVERS